MFVKVLIVDEPNDDHQEALDRESAGSQTIEIESEREERVNVLS